MTEEMQVAIEEAFEAYTKCDHEQGSPTYRPMSVCDVCRGRCSEESFEFGYLAGYAAAQSAK